MTALVFPGVDPFMDASDKLDLIQDTVTGLRVSLAELSGDVRASLTRHDRQDVVTADVERRLRAVETGSGQVPEAEMVRRADVERRVRGLETATAVISPDVENRLRGLERRFYAVPSVGAVLGLAGFVLSLWNSTR